MGIQLEGEERWGSVGGYIVWGGGLAGTGGGMGINMSNMGLCIFVKVSLICNYLLLKLYMWKHSKALSKWPFLFICSIFIVSSIGPHVWFVSSVS
jgi:hypothetical protein